MNRHRFLLKLVTIIMCISVVLSINEVAYAATYKDVLIEANCTYYTPWTDYDTGTVAPPSIWWYECRGWHFHSNYGYEACTDSMCCGRPYNQEWLHDTVYTTFPPEAYLAVPYGTTKFTKQKMANLRSVRVDYDRFEGKHRLVIRGDLWGMELDEYTITYKWSGRVPSGIGSPPSSETAERGRTTYVPNITVPSGWTFNGWRGNGISVSNGGSFKMPANNIELVGTWTPKTDIEYSVEFYKQQ